MIITEISKIDRLVESVVDSNNDFISVDINDYNLIKAQSSSLKAIELELSELSDTAIKSINKAITEAGHDDICNVLFHISGNGSSAGVKVPSLQQMQMLLDLIQDNTGAANMIWGVSEGNTGSNTIKIMIILGYSS